MADLHETDPQKYAAQNRGPGAMGVMISLTALATVSVALRLFVRIKLLHNVGVDDFLITLSIICGIVNTTITSVALGRHGGGRHFDTLTPQQQSDAIKWTIAAFCPGILSFGLPKLGVVALLTKLTEPSRAHRWFLWTSSSLVLLVLFGCVIILYAQCTPARSQWDFEVEGKCWSKWVLVDYALVAGSLSAIMDLYLAVYPGFVIAKLQMRLRKKLALTGALGIGMVGTVVAAYKCTRLKALADPDFTWNTSELVVWTCIEGSTIIIASCIPLMLPILRLIMGKAPSPKYHYRTRYSERLDDDQNRGSIPLSSKPSDLSKGSARIGEDDAITTGTMDEQDSQSIYRQAPWKDWRSEDENGRIQRVDGITVAYEEDRDREGQRRAWPVGAPGQEPRRWR